MSIKQCEDGIFIKNLFLSRGGKKIFNDFSLSIENAKITALIAPSGGGKTSFLDIVAGLLRPDIGSVQTESSSKLTVSYVFQEDRLLPWLSLYQNVLLPLQHLSSEQLIYAPEDRAVQYIKKCGLSDKIKSLPAQLSGGERQRSSLARAFAYPSDVLLMDEAFQSLDLHIKFQLMELFAALIKDEKRTVLLVTHDIREALCLSDRIIVLTGSPLKIKLDRSLGNSKVLSIRDSYIQLNAEHVFLEAEILRLLSNADAVL